MKAAGKKYEPVIYKGAGHGFMRLGEPANPQCVKPTGKRAMKRGRAGRNCSPSFKLVETARLRRRTPQRGVPTLSRFPIRPRAAARRRLFEALR